MKMTTSSSSTMVLRLAALIVMTFVVIGSEAGKLGVYWGRETYEYSLANTCDIGNFAYVNIAYLSKFGNFQTPQLNLKGPCDPANCSGLSSDIQHCQAKGIKIMLSLGGQSGGYSLVSKDDAKQLATYLWNNFLGGSSSSRPFGPAVLNGIDFDIEEGGSDYWDDLARFLSAYKQVYLSAAPQCVFPDSRLGKALDTGLFDYVWIRFFNNPDCQYTSPTDNAIIGDISPLINAWKQWSDWASSLPDPPAGNILIFLGLAAIPEEAPNGGFIHENDLLLYILPKVKESTKYGGVMIWDEYGDQLDEYSDFIKKGV